VGREVPGAKCCLTPGIEDCGTRAENPCLCGDLNADPPVKVHVILPVWGLHAPQRNCWVAGAAVPALITGGYLTNA